MSPMQRLTDKLSFKILWMIIGLLAGLCIFFIRDWYSTTNLSKKIFADEIVGIDRRVIVLETIIPEIKNFMEKLDEKIDRLEKKR